MSPPSFRKPAQQPLFITIKQSIEIQQMHPNSHSISAVGSRNTQTNNEPAHSGGFLEKEKVISKTAAWLIHVTTNIKIEFDHHTTNMVLVQATLFSSKTHINKEFSGQNIRFKQQQQNHHLMILIIN